MIKKLILVLVLAVTPLVAGPVEEADKLISDGKWAEARRLIEGTSGLVERDPRARVLLTHALVELEDHKPAVEHGKAAVKALPNDSQANLQYARAVRVKMQKTSIMKAMFSIGTYKKHLARAIELNPRNVGALQEEIGFLTQAPGIAGGDTDKAAERIENLKTINWRSAMIMQAELYGKLEDEAALMATYREMLERDAGDEQARTWLAYALQRTGSYRDADQQFGMLLKSERPGRVQLARYQLARSRVLGEYDQQKAVDYLVEYLDNFTDPPVRGLPSRSAAYWRLGLAYQQLGKKDDARGALERALELDADNKEAKAALKRL